ncbi:IolE/MocC family protein [Litchfieldia alkalitelluris]|uniref:hypothetical protein n=1 Tax=Litchfieldia alkalitelluris TaxID=304268 RepID=UPI000997532A|nr:hypothetical protein [Litchfieldia alkalitelluris]
MRKISLIAIILLFSIVGCSQQPDIDISSIIGKSEDYFRQLEEIETTASAFDGKRDVKFRLMVEGPLTEEEATILFNEILDRFKEYSSNHQEIWDYYNGYFDIKNYDDGVIYEATKVIDEELKVVSK